MKEFRMNATSTEDAVKHMQQFFGGEISENWGEYALTIDSEVAKGCIKFITFDWGVSLADFDVIFYDTVLLIEEVNSFNPIHFSYCSQGYYQHKFSNEANYQKIDQFHSVISTSKKGIDHHLLFPKGVHISTNNIQIFRQDFLNKSSFKSVSMLNKKLYEVFVDSNEEKIFAYYAPINIRMEDHVYAIRNNDSMGIMRILQLEGSVYQLLSMHIDQHERIEGNQAIKLPTTLCNDELKTIRTYAKKIFMHPSVNYSLDYLSYESGLSQAKLQEGFKFLYAHTVSDYIKHTRLEVARNFLSTTDLNVSQIVYKVGFTSRSYFTKIFKEKYSITPHDYKKKRVVVVNKD